MGALQLPPPPVEYAEAQNTFESHLAGADPAGYVLLKAISENIKISGTEPQQERFKQDVLRIDGIISRGIAGKTVVDAKAEATAVLHREVLDNPLYSKFKTMTAKDSDPLLPR